MTNQLDFNARLLCGPIDLQANHQHWRSNMGPHGSPTGSMILVLSLLAALLHPSAACIPEERNALLAFKAGFKVDSEGMLSRWTANGDCCSWGGTFCDSSGYVTRLELRPDPAFDDPSIYLKGTISPALAKLTHLKILDLGSLKQLSGSLPAALGNLKDLEYFSVRRSKLSGSIPSSYGGLTSLTWVDLGENVLAGGIPPTLGNIRPQLQYLYLGNNHLSGPIPTSLYKLSGLQDFYLNDNRLTGGISPLVGRLRNLTNLDFSSNKLKGPIPTEIGKLPKLGFLHMSGNALSGTVPTSFGNLKNLYHLTLNNNKLTGEIPPALAKNLKQLIALDLSNNKLTGPIPQGAPFSTFPASAFAGNAGLCGNPLPACKR